MGLKKLKEFINKYKLFERLYNGKNNIFVVAVILFGDNFLNNPISLTGLFVMIALGVLSIGQKINKTKETLMLIPIKRKELIDNLLLYFGINYSLVLLICMMIKGMKLDFMWLIFMVSIFSLILLSIAISNHYDEDTITANITLVIVLGVFSFLFLSLMEIRVYWLILLIMLLCGIISYRYLLNNFLKPGRKM